MAGTRRTPPNREVAAAPRVHEPAAAPRPAAPAAAPRPEAPAAAPRGCTNLKLRQLSRLVARHYEAHVAPTGLKNTQYSLLSYVVKLGPRRAGDLAAAMRLEPSTLSRNLQPLLDRGWLEALPDPDDARARVIAATPAGHELRAEAQRAWKRAQLALNQRLGTERVAALHALLDESMALLQADTDDGHDADRDDASAHGDRTA